MNKEYNFLIAFVALLCLGQELQAASLALSKEPPKQENGVSVQVVNDIEVYNQSHPHSNLLELNKTVVHSFGERVRGDKSLSTLSTVAYYPLISQEGSSTQVTFLGNSSVLITYVEIRFKGKDDGNAYVVDGGIGKYFVSFIVEVPKPPGPYAFTTEIFGIE